jgi:hypothetical protein
MIYTGYRAKEILEVNLEGMKRINSKGFFKEENCWIAFDNENGDCYVEEFNTEELAIAWVNNYFDMSEFDEFKIFKLIRGIYYIPGTGIVCVSFQKYNIESKLVRFILNYEN